MDAPLPVLGDAGRYPNMLSVNAVPTVNTNVECTGCRTGNIRCALDANAFLVVCAFATVSNFACLLLGFPTVMCKSTRKTRALFCSPSFVSPFLRRNGGASVRYFGYAATLPAPG